MSKKKPPTIFSVFLGLSLCVAFFTACGSNGSSAPVVEVDDQSVLTVEQASSGLTDQISGKYAIESTEGSYYVFGEDGRGIIQQNGTYQNADGTIEMKYDSADAGTTYQKKETTDGIKLTTQIEGAKSQNEVTYTFFDGEDGLMSADAFNGIYKLAGSDDSRMVFNGDGTFDYVQDFSYEIDGDEISITQDGSTATYKWKAKKGKIQLKSGDTIITKLVPAGDAESKDE